MILEHRVTTTEAGERLDRLLTTLLDDEHVDDHIQGTTRSQIKRALDEGAATLDGKRARAGQRLKAGQLLRFEPPPPEPFDLEPEAIPLEIVYEDEHVIVVNKAAGMVVHPGAGQRRGTLVAALLAHCELGGGEQLRPGIVHRIDKDTSGLLVVSKDVTSHERLARQFHDHTVGREYLALVRRVPERSGTIRTSYGRHPHHRLKFSGQFGGQRHAVTHFTVRESFATAAALVSCRLETGRTHQVRVHLSEAGHPILGDLLYSGGSGGDHRLDAALSCLDRQALHATHLAFIHPVSGETIDLRAAPPTDFQNALDELRRIT